MSLADELLADLEDGDEEFGEEDDENEVRMDTADASAVSNRPNDAVASETASYNVTTNSVRAIAKLRDSKQLVRVRSDILKYQDKPRTEMFGPIESDPEYQLIVEANNITVEIDNEINIIHKFCRDNYSKRFPELESLVANPIEYMKTVKGLGNTIEKSKSNEILQAILTPATIMVVSVTASTTQGVPLTAEELDRVMEACDMAVELIDIKNLIFEYVESKMSFIAPNISVIVGASTAAKLIGIAGGLTNLSKMPACNIMILGSQKKSVTGFSSTQTMPHMGLIYFSDIVQKTPPDLRRKAARLVAAKCTLAARVDSFHESSNAAIGESLKADIEQKLDKLQEPPPVKTIKPLPAPIEETKKKRGGRRARKMKERLGLTEMRKQANRMNFGDIEDDAYQEDLGFSKGTIGSSKHGRIRGPLVDSKTKARISKTLQQKIQKQNLTWGGSTTVRKQVSGTASSVAFTPLQGLEIVNPQAAEKRVQEANQKYFSATASFINLKN